MWMISKKTTPIIASGKEKPTEKKPAASQLPHKCTNKGH